MQLRHFLRQESIGLGARGDHELPRTHPRAAVGREDRTTRRASRVLHGRAVADDRAARAGGVEQSVGKAVGVDLRGFPAMG